MEKKNINIWVVRICTILLLTVFTIGRKYGQDLNAENLINSLQQQPCACCLNFNDVSEVAKVIDDEKTKLEIAKNQLQTDNNILEVAKTSLEKENGKLLGEKDQLLTEKNLLQGHNKQLVEEKNKIDNLLKDQNNKNNNLIKNIEEINKKKTDLENEKKICLELFQEAKKESSNLEEIL